MKKFFLKLAIFCSVMSIMLGMSLSVAQAAPPAAPSTTADNIPAADPMTKFQIKGENCIDTNDLSIAVVLEEGFQNSTPKGNTSNSYESVRDCFRINMCKLTKVKNSYNVLSQDTKTDYINRMICQSELKATCADEYRQISNPTAAATSDQPYVTCQKVQVLLTKKGGAGLIYLYVGTIYKWAASIVGILCVLIIVVNGIIISASAGDQQAVTNAKTRITQSIVALVILFLSALILNTANPNFYTSDNQPPDSNYGGVTAPGATDIPPAIPDNAV